MGFISGKNNKANKGYVNPLKKYLPKRAAKVALDEFIDTSDAEGADEGENLFGSRASGSPVSNDENAAERTPRQAVHTAQKIRAASVAMPSLGEFIPDRTEHAKTGGKAPFYLIPGDIDYLIVLRLAASCVLLAAGVFAKTSPTLRLVFYILSALCAGYDVILGGAISVYKTRKPGDDGFLVSVAVIVLFAAGEGIAAAAAMLLFRVFALFRGTLAKISRRAASDILDTRSDTVRVVRNGEETIVPAADVSAGEIISIRAGERVPLDCIVIDGSSQIDTSPLTGETPQVAVAAESVILSGSYNLTRTIRAVAATTYDDSTSSGMLKFLRSGEDNNSGFQKFIYRLSGAITPVVALAAVITSIVLPLISDVTVHNALIRACGLLIVAGSASIILSVPVTILCGIARGAEHGILFKGSASMDGVSNAKVTVFDKTDILTSGRLRVSEVRPAMAKLDTRLLMKIAAHAEYHSSSPVGRAVAEGYGGELRPELISNFKEIDGFGVTVMIDDKRVAAGNAEFIEKFGIPFERGQTSENTIYVVVEGKYAGSITLADTLKPDAADAVAGLKAADGSRVVLFSPDSRGITSRIAMNLGIEEYYAELTETAKLRRLEDIKSRLGERGGLIFVGDSKSSPEAFAAADLGISIGGGLSESAEDSVGIVAMGASPMKILSAIEYAKFTKLILLQNIGAALGVKAVLFLLSLSLPVPVFVTLFLDGAVSVLALLNATRALKPGSSKQQEPNITE